MNIQVVHPAFDPTTATWFLESPKIECASLHEMSLVLRQMKGKYKIEGYYPAPSKFVAVRPNDGTSTRSFRSAHTEAWRNTRLVISETSKTPKGIELKVGDAAAPLKRQRKDVPPDQRRGPIIPWKDRPTAMYRDRVVELYFTKGVKPCEITTRLGMTRGVVNGIIYREKNKRAGLNWAGE